MTVSRPAIARRLLPVIGLCCLSVSGTAASTASTASIDQGSCQSPYPPVETRALTEGVEALPALAGTEAMVPLPDTNSLDAPRDTDGDGQQDRDLPVNQPGDPAGLERGEGRIVLERHGYRVAIGQPIGDLDGDGRDDIAAVVRPADDMNGPEVESWMVPGATPNGTHQLADVGVRLPPGWVQPAGDLDGDGHPEVVVSVRFGEASSLRSSLFSGAEIGAMRPGADAGAVAMQSLPGALLGVARVSGRVTLITAVPIDNAAGEWIGAVVMLDLDGRDLELTTVPAPWAPNGSGAVPGPLVGVEALTVASSGTYLTATQHPGRGNTQPAQTYRWRLDEPCAGATTGTPPPARPRNGSATYTG